ncbi:O-antigen ligase family protein [Notoacmeibacter marinus]|uniref:O-antigen ligase family protein n=1 Tax=Notoacmeibacter marinus TaxID=1876515 RepID=UPI000DF4A1C8|nr:O-antigen ligase family protein [Notoacmeibacter marinus]
MRSDSSSAVPTSYARYTGYLVYFVIAALPLSFAIADILMDLAHYQTYRVRREFTGYSQVVLIALLLWGCLKNCRNFDLRILGLMAVPILVLAGLYLIHPPIGPADEIASTLWRWTLIFLFALVFYGAVASGAIAIRARGVVTALVVGASLYSLFALAFHFGFGHLEQLNKNDLIGFGNVRSSTRLLTPVMMCAIVMFTLPGVGAKTRWFFLSAALLMSVLSGYTGSRSIILALVSISILAALLSPNFRYLRIAIAVIATLAIGVAVADFVPLVLRWLSATGTPAVSGSLDVFRYSSSGRNWVWAEILQLALQRPFFGWGGVDFDSQTVGHLSNAHNIVLQIFYEVGLVGLVSMAILAALFLLRVLRIVRDKAASPYVTATALAACAIMADALVSPALWFQYSAFLFVVLVVMTLTAKQDPRPVGNAVPRGAEGPADSEAAG